MARTLAPLWSLGPAPVPESWSLCQPLLVDSVLLFLYSVTTGPEKKAAQLPEVSLCWTQPPLHMQSLVVLRSSIGSVPLTHTTVPSDSVGLTLKGLGILGSQTWLARGPPQPWEISVA